MNTENLRHERFELPEGCACKSFVMRETCGYDEQQAARMLESSADSTLANEIIRASLVQVNDRNVAQPFFEIDGWNSTTRAFLAHAYEKMNSLPDVDFEAFKNAATVFVPAAADRKDEKKNPLSL